jgi:hypothetical protein
MIDHDDGDEDHSIPELPASDIHYYKLSDGGWLRREYSGKCSKYMLFGECVGAKGHYGDHWYYGKDGSYHWYRNGDDPGCLRSKNEAAGMIPPGHKEWINPVQKSEEYHSRIFKDSMVENKAEIERLDRGDLRDNESSCEPWDEGDHRMFDDILEKDILEVIDEENI